MFPEITVRLPDWVSELLAGRQEIYPTVEDRMRLAVELSRLNSQHGTGGPFGAVVFESASGRLLAPGVNLVTSLNCSVLHAEVVAIMIAQRSVGDFDLGGVGRPRYELVASTEPCAMRLVCGARAEDVERIGFDEGMKPEGWTASLEERGIAVVRDVLQDEAAAVLREYSEGQGEIYNGRSGE